MEHFLVDQGFHLTGKGSSAGHALLRRDEVPAPGVR